MNIYFVGYPGSGKSYVAKKFKDFIEPILQYCGKNIRYVEMSKVVREWQSKVNHVENVMNTEIGSDRLASLLVGELVFADFNVISGVREPHLLDLAGNKLIVEVWAKKFTRKQRYKADGKTNFKEANERAKQLGIDKILLSTDLFISTEDKDSYDNSFVRLLGLFKQFNS